MLVFFLCLSACLPCLSVWFLLVEKKFVPVVEPVSPISPSAVGIPKAQFLSSIFSFFPLCTFFAYYR